MSNIGNVYIADLHNHRVRKVTVSTGIITLIAGTGSASYSGDNGAATSATLYEPTGVAVDTSGRTLQLLSAALRHSNLCSFSDNIVDNPKLIFQYPI